MNALELRGLTKHYKDFTLGPLDLTLPGGTICGLIGENGAGKSTTIKLILDMLQRDGGTGTISAISRMPQFWAETLGWAQNFFSSSMYSSLCSSR